MKKILSFLIVVLLLAVSGCVCYANDYLGNAVYTDIVTYINHVPIQSHNFNGKTLIAAEDLVYFGFDVKWNEYKQTLTITRNESKEIDIPFATCSREEDFGKTEFCVTTTNVSVYTGDYKYSSYGGIAGYTLIEVTDLLCFEGVKIVWVPEVRAVKIWIEDGLEMYDYMLRAIPRFTYYEDHNAPQYSYYWNWLPSSSFFSLKFYMKTDTGYYVDSDDGVLTITDVIDADGNSILKAPVSSIGSGTSILPYVYGFSDAYLSMYVSLDADDLYPRTASEDGGIIKFNYKEYSYALTSEVTESIRVDRLPYNQ